MSMTQVLLHTLIPTKLKVKWYRIPNGFMNLERDFVLFLNNFILQFYLILCLYFKTIPVGTSKVLEIITFMRIKSSTLLRM